MKRIVDRLLHAVAPAAAHLRKPPIGQSHPRELDHTRGMDPDHPTAWRHLSVDAAARRLMWSFSLKRL
jgi:hypothetical protein